MDLRTKLVFSLVGVALISMAALGSMAYMQSRDLMRTSSLRQLDALAESRKQRVESLVTDWRDRVRLMSSRTRLLASQFDPASIDTDAGRAAIGDALAEIARSVPGVRVLVVFDLEGTHIASTSDGATRRRSSESDRAHAQDGSPTFVGIERGGGALEAHFVTPLLVDDRPVGWLETRLAADDIAELARDTTGLGPTGETLVVTADEDGYRALHPTRHASRASGGDPTSEGETPRIDPAQLALAGLDTMVWENAVDYRDEPVWAATRSLDDLGWGVVVKYDASQEEGPINAFRTRLFRGALTFAAFAILAGILLGLHLARPIHDLADVVNSVREGDRHARARIHHRDEIGMLARTFNRMADALAVESVDLEAAVGPPDDEETGETAEEDETAAS